MVEVPYAGEVQRDTRGNSFAQITSNVTLQNQLKTMYGNVNNIDLWIGTLSEDHVAGADVGPLMLAGLLDQFTRLHDGDRLWFTNDSGLTSAELSPRLRT